MPHVPLREGDRLHMLVWKVRWPDDTPWRVAAALNGTPITFGAQVRTWREAMDEAEAARIHIARWRTRPNSPTTGPGKGPAVSGAQAGAQGRR